MPNRVCGYCKKKYDPDKHTWSAGYGCDHYCSQKCCTDTWFNQDAPLDVLEREEPSCPCY